MEEELKVEKGAFAIEKQRRFEAARGDEQKKETEKFILFWTQS
jgi:hypothetical protein